MLPEWFWTAIAFASNALLAALLSGYAVNRWKGREEHIERRFDELCVAIVDTANLAAEYWSEDAQSQGASLCEAKIRSHLIKIAGLRVILADHVSRSTSREMEVAESAFIRQTTGGQFGAHNRTADMQRVIGCHCAAAELIVAIRRARLRDLQGLRRRK